MESPIQQVFFIYVRVHHAKKTGQTEDRKDNNNNNMKRRIKQSTNEFRLGALPGCMDEKEKCLITAYQLKKSS